MGLDSFVNQGSNFSLFQNKRGFFFVIITIFLVSIFLLSYTFYSAVEERNTAVSRINSMNNFIHTLEEDLSRNLYIFGYRSLFLVQDKIVSTGQYSGDLNEIFDIAFREATFDGEESEILIDSYESAIIASENEFASEINAQINLSTLSFNVTQFDPWSVVFIWNISLNVSDISGFANWTIIEPIYAYVPITYFEDPIYYVETNGAINKKISKNLLSPLYVSGGSVSNLSVYLSQGSYVSSAYGPRFLDRLEGNLSASSQGIESFVNLNNLSLQGINVEEKSIVDYIYFSASSPSPLCGLAGMPGWFRIDNVSASRYNISC